MATTGAKFRIGLWVPALMLQLVPALALRAAQVCDETTVLTLVGTDTSTDRALLALRSPATEVGAWLVVIDGSASSARLLPDSLSGLRSGASYGPGPFLGGTSCGEACLQPVRLSPDGWQPLGPPIRNSRAASVHFTYDRSGVPWASLHSLSSLEDLVDVTAFRWNGTVWEDRGRLLVRAVGSPAAVPDPRTESGILVGSGRFLANGKPAHWVPALPSPGNSPGGQVIAVGAAAAYLTFDSRLYTSLDGGSTWFLDRWTPWRERGDERPGDDYWIDLPAAANEGSLAALWYDERKVDSAALHLASWSPRSGWSQPARLPLGEGSMPVDHALKTAAGRWLLLGPCRGSGRDTHLEALVAEPGSTTLSPAELPLERGWSR